MGPPPSDCEESDLDQECNASEVSDAGARRDAGDAIDGSPELGGDDAAERGGDASVGSQNAGPMPALDAAVHEMDGALLADAEAGLLSDADAASPSDMDTALMSDAASSGDADAAPPPDAVGSPDADARAADAGDTDAAQWTDSGAASLCVDGGVVTSTGVLRSDLGMAPVPALVTASLQRVPLAARTLVGDPVRRRLYALAAADDPDYPNQLVSLASDTGAILGAVDVGPNPSTLSLAGDGATLWVGSAPLLEIRSVDLRGATPSLSASYPLPDAWKGTNRESLVVVPPISGGRSTLIDLRSASSTYLGQVTLASGVATARAPSGGVPSRITAGPPGYFFAYNDSTSGFQFYTIDATGNSLYSTEHIALIYGYGRRVVYDPDGVVYATSGEVIDVRNPNAPRRAGKFAWSGTFIPLAGTDHVLLAHEDERTTELADLLDTRTFTRLSRFQLTQALPAIRSTVALEGNRVAFLADNGQGPAVYISNPLPSELPSQRLDGFAKPQGAFEFTVAARALVYDASRRLLYAAIGGAAERYANRVISIDPARGEIVNSIPVGSSPVALALSDDASVLWVSLAGSSAVRRIDLACGLLVPGPEYDLPIRGQARRLFPLPGRPGSVAAQIAGSQSSPGYSGTAFFDDGLLRPGFNRQRFGASRMVAGPPGIFFGYDDATSSYTFYTIQYRDSGTSQESFSGLISGYNQDLSYDPDGYVYTTGGEIVDVRDPLAPRDAGRLPSSGAVLPLPGPTALMVTGGRLRKYDTTTLSEVGSRPTQCRSFLSTTDLVNAGAHRVAYLAFDPIAQDSGVVCVITDSEFIP